MVWYLKWHFQWFSNNCFCWRMFINYPIAASLVVSAESISRKDYRKSHQMVGDRRKAYHHTLLHQSIRTTHHSSSSIRPSCCTQISSHTLSNILKEIKPIRIHVSWKQLTKRKSNVETIQMSHRLYLPPCIKFIAHICSIKQAKKQML